MKTMKKIVAILAAALMLCSILPLSAMAADGDETITVTGSTGTLASDSLSISWDGTNYQVVNYKDNSSTAIRYSDSAHFRIYVGNEFYVQGKDGALMSKVVINCVSSYLINNTSNTVSDGWTVSANGNAITYTATGGSASELHISIGKQSRVTSVVITPYVETSADCDHNSLNCGDTCPECGEYTKEHVYANNCVAECENGCGTANPNYADHVYDGAYDAACNVCSATREVNFPEADSVLTIDQANEIGLGMSHDTTTTSKYYVTGVVESIANTSYGNLYIQDDAGNKLYIYGTYSADGSTRYDAMVEKPEVGMTITVYGVIGNYSSAAQMKNGWITEMIGGCEHEYEFDCSKACALCGLELRPEAECKSDAEYACVDGLCIYCGGDVNALEHDFDDEWDPDCNYGCGYTREVEEKPAITEATIDFSSTTQRTEYSTSAQKWENDGLTVLNEKGASTSNVGDYSNPARFYKSSNVTISFSGMTSLVIDATGVGSSYLWDATLTAAGLEYTVENQIYTITFAVPTDSITLTASNQARAISMTATAVKQGDDECTHEWNAATCTTPKTCSVCGATDGEALGHNYVEDIIDATCTATGTATYECSVCGDSYSEEIPMKPHNYVDGVCDICGAKAIACAPITSADQLVSGEYILVVSSGYAPTTYSDGWVLSGLPTIADGNIVDGTGLLWTLTVDGSTVTIKDANGVYISPKGSATNGIKEGEYAWTWAFADGVFTFAGDQVYLASNATAGNDNKFRAYKATTISGQPSNYLHQFTLYAPVAEEPACEHEYFTPCDQYCMICGELTNPDAAHNVIHVEAVAATCAANGNIEYWYCDVCGAAWLNAECTQNTNLKAVVLPTTGEHTYDDEYDTDCNVCGDVREVEAPEIVYGDADGNGEIEVLDAALIQQFLAGYEVEMNEAAADADGNGEVEVLDAALIQQFLAGYDVALGPDKVFNDGELGEW